MILYKYVVADRVDILEDGLIRFTQASSFNDPFETRPYIDALIERATIDETVERIYSMFYDIDEKLFEEEYNRILLDTKHKYNLPVDFMERIKIITPNDGLNLAKKMIGPLLKSLVGLDSIQYKEIAQSLMSKAISEKYGILSLSEENDNLLLWSHYANSHTGFVIGFNTNHTFFDQRISEHDNIRKLCKVHYSIDRPIFEGLNLDGDEYNQMNKWVRDFFLTKSVHWSYENEWRMIMRIEDADNIINAGNDAIYLYRLPREVISCIILGCRMDNLNKEKLIQASMKYDNIYLYQTKVDLRKFRLLFEEIPFKKPK